MVEGGSLSLENISVRQESNHPEKHGVFVAAREYKLKALWICYVFGVNHGRGRTGISYIYRCLGNGLRNSICCIDRLGRLSKDFSASHNRC